MDRHRYLVQKARNLKHLAIVGSDPDTRHLAPFDNPSIDIWVFNEAGNHEWCKRWSAVFQMHPPNIYKGHNTKDPRHWDWLQQSHGKPIYMQAVDPQVPDSIAYPLDEARKLAGVKMFSSTFAYMAALAVMQGYECIDIYGVGLSSSEYQYQAQSYQFWYGFLRGRLGDNVSNAVTYLERNIFDAPLYGYDGNFSFGAEYFAERAKRHNASWQAAEKHLQNSRKAIDRAIEKQEFDKVKTLYSLFQQSAMECGEYAGRESEAARYQTFGERDADRGGFERSAAQAQRDGEAKRPEIWHYGGMIEYVWNIWQQTKNAAAANQLSSFISKMGATAYDVGALMGAYKENIEYINKYDEAALAVGVSRG